MEIPLKNRKGEIVAHTLVSEEDYPHLSKFKWYLSNNYVQGGIKGKVWRLHRYIMIILLGNKDLTSRNFIDHINGNTLDNTRENLRVVTHSENMRNKQKKEGTSSEYIGVCFDKNKWKAYITINNKTLQAYYKNEIHAAHQYNLWIDEYDLKYANKNNIELPKDFVLYEPVKKTNDLPKGITYAKNKNKFRVRITIDNKQKSVGEFEKLEDAISRLQLAEKEKQEYLQNKLMSTPKMYNEHKQCIFKIKDKEIIIDEKLYYDIIQYSWHHRSITYSYFHAYVNGKKIGLTNFIMNYTGNDVIDHINNNTLDNRRENLRITTTKQNSMNRSSAKNSFSNYIGVSKTGKKFQSRICVDGNPIYLGLHNSEIEAAKARDLATKKYFGEYGNLNFPENNK